MAHAYANVIRKSLNLKLNYIISKNFKRALKFGSNYKAKAFKNLGHLKLHHEPNIIIVAITPSKLKHIIKYLTLFKKSKIYIEKPIGINYEENIKLLKILKKNKLSNFHVLLNRRFYKSTIDAQKVLKSHKQNTRYIVINNFHNFSFAPKNGFIGKKLKFWPYMNSIHLLDYFFIFGRSKILKVERIFVRNFDKTKKVMIYKLYFKSGDIGIYNTHYNINGNWSVNIFSGEILIELKPLEKLTVRFSDKIKKYDLEEKDRQFKPGLYRMVEGLILKKNYIKNFNGDLNHSSKLMYLIKKIYNL